MVVLLLGVTVTAVANEPNEKTFKRSGKVFGSAFTGMNVSVLDGDNGDPYKEFVLDRLEIGYIYNFSENWLFKGCLDIGDPKDESSLQHTAFARNAFGEYHNDKLIFRFGMITGVSFNFIEKEWGYRYVAKCYQEHFGYSSSRDIGVTAAYNFNDVISVDAIISNGEGYKLTQYDPFLEYGIGATFKPFKGAVVRAYADMTETDVLTENTYSCMMGYHFNNGSSVGAEYNKQNNANVNQERDQQGGSFYSTLKVCNKMKIYARYDYNDRAANWSSGDNTQVLFVGAEFQPIKGVKITPNYIYTSHSVAAMPTENEYRVSCEFKF
ncbi:MAG: hypothetical protein ACK5JS_07730 [Mangrovibacterium sp.]